MSRPSRKKARSSGRQADSPARIPGAPKPQGLPAEESIIEEKLFTSPKGKTYRIIKTTEVDATDEPPPQGKGKRK